MKTIKGRIARLVIIVGAVAVLIVGGTTIVLNYSSTNNMLKQSMTETAKLASERVRQELRNYETIAMEVGSIARLSNSETPLEDKKAIIDQRVSTHKFVSGDILDEKGRSIFDGTDYSDTDNYRVAMEGKTHISEPVPDKSTGKMTISVSAPLWKGGIPGTQIVGVTMFMPSETFLNDIMSEISISNCSAAYMLDSSGNTIADVDCEKVKKAENIEVLAGNSAEYAELAALHKKMISGESGFGTYEQDGVNKLLAYAPVRDTNGWSFAVDAPLSDFMQSTINSVYITLALLLICIILCITVGIWVGGKIGLPITLCAERLEKLSIGDLQSDVPVIKSKDETGTLSNATARIVNALKDVVKDIVYVLSELSEGNLTASSTFGYAGDFIPIQTATEKILISLNNAMAQINESSSQVASGAGQVSDAAQSLAQGATEQASSVEELSATINQTCGQVQVTAQNALEASRIANEAGEGVVESNQHMRDMTEAMDEIANTSREISKIISTIEEIAFQINRLARAGLFHALVHEVLGAVNHFDAGHVAAQELKRRGLRHHQGFAAAGGDRFLEACENLFRSGFKAQHRQRLARIAAGERRAAFVQLGRGAKIKHATFAFDAEGGLFQRLGQSRHCYGRETRVNDVSARRKDESCFVVAAHAVEPVRGAQRAAIERVDVIGIRQVGRVHPDAVADQRAAARGVRFAEGNVAHWVEMPAHEAEAAGVNHIQIIFDMHVVTLLFRGNPFCRGS